MYVSGNFATFLAVTVIVEPQCPTFWYGSTVRFGLRRSICRDVVTSESSKYAKYATV